MNNVNGTNQPDEFDLRYDPAYRSDPTYKYDPEYRRYMGL